ncbi:MAG: NADP-dependent malic enzyme [Pseudomonadaceae bacterium]|nr:NADP-dependent malic enzyme [Pseudomonadaceae bacterium]
MAKKTAAIFEIPAEESDALRYHAAPRAGKIEVVSTKSLTTQADLSLGYTPGVAEVCETIAAHPAAANRYTSKANLVAVVTNGTAVLGLGNIGPLAAKPVMEGKAVLFKKFAGIDVFDLELAENDPDAFVDTVVRLAPTFGGINLEDIKAPECFYIEKQLREKLDIPVLHDDQHGTAIIVAAAFINAIKVAGKDRKDVRIVCVGAGAAGLACMNLLADYGVPRKHITLVDVKGVIHAGRDDLHESHQPFAHKTKARTLAEALVGADVFVGLSAGGVLKPEMLKGMAESPIVFAMANPTPEIMPDLARKARPDAIIGTGRSDFPNQINNVLGFPYLFRGALDCGATTFNTEMKLAAAEALAALARKDAEPGLAKAYKGHKLKFGPEYLIPKPFDARLLSTIAPAVAKAAMDSGVASRPVDDLPAYAASLRDMVDQSFRIMRQIYSNARQRHAAKARRIVYPEGEDPRILQTAQGVIEEGIAHPIILGRTSIVEPLVKELGLSMEEGKDYTLINPQQETEQQQAFVQEYYGLRAREGVSLAEAATHMRSRWMTYGCMMVRNGLADALVAGVSGRFYRFLPVAARLINDDADISNIYALNLVMGKDQLLFMADTHVQVSPNPHQLCNMAALAAKHVAKFGVTPRLGLLSYSNFGAANHAAAVKMREALALIRQHHPELEVEGEMQADTALSMEVMQRIFPASTLKAPANVLLFPDVDSASIAFNLFRMVVPEAEYVGPMLMGMKKPVHILSLDAPVRRIINMSALAVAEA